MNRDQIKGRWQQLQGDAKERWGKLTDDDMTRIEGDRDKLIGTLQERYGKTREEVERDVDEWSGQTA